MRHVRRACLFGLLLIAPATTVRAQELCFSDDELMSSLIEVHMFSLGQLAGTCVGRFPDMSSKALALTQQLENTYRAEFAANDRLSLQAFERSYPGRGKEMRDQNTGVASEPSRKAAAQYTRKECENIISALEATVVMNDWKLATLPAHMSFQQERAHTPTCR